MLYKRYNRYELYNPETHFCDRKGIEMLRNINVDCRDNNHCKSKKCINFKCRNKNYKEKYIKYKEKYLDLKNNL